MVNIHVEYVIDKPAEEVFDAITDHESYTRFSAFDRAELLEEGKPHRNGGRRRAPAHRGSYPLPGAHHGLRATGTHGLPRGGNAPDPAAP